MAGPGSGSSPVVSVVIPAYNRERFIGSCIDSALKQDFHSFEVIVVDDGSTDGTADVCRSYGGKIRYFRKPNGGAASALNYGIKKMEGGWFKWLSSDDELEDGALRALMSGAGEGAAGVVYGDFTKIDSRGSVIGRHRE
ncbi:MAG: glycosyltransferase family 2 protein, partial [Nitrososphaerota archaeon]|nr:glycosyltransferase family 2 protein [Nitrososphaerota archaeon]